MGAGSKDEAIKSPFVERLLKKGYEVLYLVEPIDEYCIQSLPEFDGKKFQNVAKEGLEIDSGEDAKKKNEEMAKDLEPLLNWLKEDALKVISLLCQSILCIRFMHSFITVSLRRLQFRFILLSFSLIRYGFHSAIRLSNFK